MSENIEKQTNQKSANANQKVMNRVKARIIGELNIPVKKDAGKSNVVPQDPAHSLSLRGEVIEPPFDMMTLAMLPEHSSEMEQCIEAMSVNIEGFGHRFKTRIKDIDKASDKTKNEIKKEHVRLINFFNYCTLESFVDFRKKLRKDLETTGNAYIEVIRSNSGDIQSLTHIPSYQMRLGRLDPKQIESSRKILELQEDGNMKIAVIKEYRRFRKYVQSKTTHLRNLSTIGGSESVWFKEFGDPRNYDALTGEIYDEIKSKVMANEIIHIKLYSPRTPYGLPRYIGNMLSIFGDRAAEEINYITFRNNNIPSMVVLVNNGQLTEGSIDRINSFVESQIQGSDNYSKFLLLEAEGTEEGEESGNHSKIEIKPLTETQQKDAMFQKYSENNQDKLRRVWRLPPIFVGRTSDYTRSTAETSRVLADEQVFAPERATFDNLINRFLFPEMNIVHHVYCSNSPNTTDNQQLVKILSGAEKTGGMTPRIARSLLEDILSAELPSFPEDFPADTPFSLTMAEAVKNKADPTEPGQQVTALKYLMGGDEDNDDDDTDEEFLDRLVRLNKKYEERLNAELENSREQSILNNDDNW